MNLCILYEDNHVLAAEKPCNMLSMADESGDRDILTELKTYIKLKYNKPGAVYLGLVHRLDRPAGGAMIFARTSKAAARLAESFQKGEVEKTYYAVLQKAPAEKQRELTGYMVKDGATNTSRMAGTGEKGAKFARLSYEVLSERENLALAKIRLYTGRPHQIRVQFADINCPLYGDLRYGGEKNRQLALWSHEICFPHPVKDEKIRVGSMPPDVYPWNLFFD